MPDVAQRPHTDQLQENLSARELLPAYKQDDRHQQRRQPETQGQHGERIQSLRIEEAPEDGQRPERRGRDRDEENPCELFHESLVQANNWGLL